MNRYLASIKSTTLITFLSLIAITATLQGFRLPSLFAIGLLLGMVLFLSQFGFASTYRKLILHGETNGIKAQIIMLIVATCLFAPILSAGSIFGMGVTGAIAPLSLSVVIGAFMFGIGMQLGGGCGSGTLYSFGGGSMRMGITLLAFIAGSFWASLHMTWWQALPSAGVWVLGNSLGWTFAVLLQVWVLIGLYIWTPRATATTLPTPKNWRQTFSKPFFFRPWSLLEGALALAILNFATLIISGHPWSITWAFTLWGAETATYVGWNPASSTFWQGDFQQAALANGIFRDETSLMDIGLILGALLAAILSNRLTFTLQAPPRAIAASLIGGLAMGYGARIAYGCNIGAFFSGVASTSLHGWLWIISAIAGTWIGVHLRPKFGLAN
ncbi:MAG: YeeE/YedE family protein [Methylotenera sp.]|uniref:YeeE/YedE family protein n=1 Tax=Methylotenera sp. TaxID=2051956 RepID=UPI0024878173|nr:YeeE/YedE family protein [Methylotenera sp.]MDI1309302.1 YeeE/YedE family protein [Methylotenera sp.]